MEIPNLKTSTLPDCGNIPVNQQIDIREILDKFKSHPGDIEIDLLAEHVVELIANINSKYGNTVDLRMGAEEAIRNLSSTGQFSSEEIEIIHLLFLEVIDYVEQNDRAVEVQEKKFNGLQFCMKNKPVKHNREKKAKEDEFMLPNNMAVGFMCALAGGLLCIVPIPGAQIAGVEMIIMGSGFFLNGLANGERPYYVNPETGERIDYPRPNPGPEGPGGIGIKF